MNIPFHGLLSVLFDGISGVVVTFSTYLPSHLYFDLLTSPVLTPSTSCFRGGVVEAIVAVRRAPAPEDSDCDSTGGYETSAEDKDGVGINVAAEARRSSVV